MSFKKFKLNLSSPVIIQMEAGEVEALTDGQAIYVQFGQGLPNVSVSEEDVDDEETETKSAPKKLSIKKVVDDTKKTSTKKRPAPKKGEEIPHSDVAAMDVGDKILVTLDMDDYRDKKLSAEIDHFSEEDGEDKIYVKFHDDGEIDFLRENDKVFPFAVKM